MKFPLDPEWQEAIRRAPTLAKAKAMGSDPAHPIRGDWEQVKRAVMKEGAMAKFRQNPTLHALLNTAGAFGLVFESTDPYWGMKKGKGENMLGRVLLDVAEALAMQGVRPDQTMFTAPAEAAVAESAGVEESKEGDAEAIVEAAKEQVANANVIQIQKGGDRGSSSGGSNDVYLIINPGAQVEQKTHRARQTPRNRTLSWEGMTVTKESQSGGSAAEGEQMRTDSGSSLEVKVEKLDS
jgi:hypothetical protein